MATKRYYRVGPSFWEDHPNWTDDMRLSALYILTSPHRTTEGLFRMPLAYAATDLGWDPKRFEDAFRRLIGDRFVEYDGSVGVCLIVNALKWQAPENPNQVKHAVRALRALPDTPLLSRLVTLAETHSERFHKALVEEFAQRIPKSPAPSHSSNSFSGSRQFATSQQHDLERGVGTDAAGELGRGGADLAFSGGKRQ